MTAITYANIADPICASPDVLRFVILSPVSQIVFSTRYKL
jgi:hypothetical protein